MGRATIISGGDEGYYTVALARDAEGITARLAEIAARLATLATAIAAAETAAEQSRLRLEQLTLQKQQAALTAATAADARAVWCADLTEDLEAGAEVGTIEVNGETGQILITPGGDTATALGRLQHPAASTPAGVAYNMAVMPAWQKWRPTYRIGEILDIDTAADTCTVGIEDQRSRYQGIPINQDGTTWESDRGAAMSGWADFAARNPSFALVTNVASTTIANTQALASDLAEVNEYVNSRSHYTRDAQQYGKLEHWTVMTEGGAGDCEDYALTKAQMLLARGYPASALHIEVGQTLAGEGHAWLIVQTDGGDIALDNNYSRPMRSWELPYTDRMRQTGADWKTTGVQLADVPIAYMDGADSSVFEVGDRVVVRFIDQDWDQPEVIGFESHPRAPAHIYALVPVDGTSSKIRAYGTPTSPIPAAWLKGGEEGGGYYYYLPQACAGTGAGDITVVRRKEPTAGWDDFAPTLDVRIYRAGTGELSAAYEVNLWEDTGIYEYFTTGLPTTPIYTRIEHIGKISFSPTGRLLVPIVMRRGDLRRRYGAGWIELSGTLVGRIVFIDYGITGVVGASPPSGARAVRTDGDATYFLDAAPLDSPAHPAVRIVRYYGTSYGGQVALSDLAAGLYDSGARPYDLCRVAGTLYAVGPAAVGSRLKIVALDAESLTQTAAVTVPLADTSLAAVTLHASGGRLVLTVSGWWVQKFERLVYSTELGLIDSAVVPGVTDFYATSCIA